MMSDTGKTYMLNSKSVIAIDAIDGVKYSFRRAWLRIIAKMTREFKIVPGILVIKAVIPAVIAVSYTHLRAHETLR